MKSTVLVENVVYLVSYLEEEDCLYCTFKIAPESADIRELSLLTLDLIVERRQERLIRDMVHLGATSMEDQGWYINVFSKEMKRRVNFQRKVANIVSEDVFAAMAFVDPMKERAVLFENLEEEYFTDLDKAREWISQG